MEKSRNSSVDNTKEIHVQITLSIFAKLLHVSFSAGFRSISFGEWKPRPQKKNRRIIFLKHFPWTVKIAKSIQNCGLMWYSNSNLILSFIVSLTHLILPPLSFLSKSDSKQGHQLYYGITNPELLALFKRTCGTLSWTIAINEFWNVCYVSFHVTLLPKNGI